MTMVTKVLSLTANLSTESILCEGCPALDDHNSRCLHLNKPLEFEKLSDDTYKFFRAESCPFNCPKCWICKKPLLPVEVKTNQWDLSHYCGTGKTCLPEIRISSNSYDAVITQYNGYILSIKKAFTQR